VSTGYHIYANTGAGDPINYTSPAATVSALTWTSAPLSYPGTWSFGIRAFDTVSGLEEGNLDCAVTIILDSNGNDITSQPLPPPVLRALAMAGGAIRVEWYYPPSSRPKTPTGFYVYLGTNGTPNYATPAATVAYSTGIANSFVANITGPAGGTTYVVGVRAYNVAAEETNTNTVTVTADSAGPGAVVSLTGVATATG
jgi:hypothetical protein